MPRHNSDDEFSIKVAISIWFCLCVFSAVWLFLKFSNGHNHFYHNLHVVEDSLRRMQERIDYEQRRKSIGCVETLEEIVEGSDEPQQVEKDENVEQQTRTDEEKVECEIKERTQQTDKEEMESDEKEEIKSEETKKDL